MPSCSRPMTLVGICRNTAPTPPDVAEQVDPEARQAGDRVGEVGVVGGLELAPVALGQSGTEQVAGPHPARSGGASAISRISPSMRQRGRWPPERWRSEAPSATMARSSRSSSAGSVATGSAPRPATPAPPASSWSNWRAVRRTGRSSMPGRWARRRSSSSGLGSSARPRVSDWPLWARGTTRRRTMRSRGSRSSSPPCATRAASASGIGRRPTARSRRSASARANSSPKAGACPARRSRSPESRRITVEGAAAEIAAGLGRPSNAPAMPTASNGREAGQLVGLGRWPGTLKNAQFTGAHHDEARGCLPLADQLLSRFEQEQLRLFCGASQLIVAQTAEQRVTAERLDRPVEVLALDRNRFHDASPLSAHGPGCVTLVAGVVALLTISLYIRSFEERLFNASRTGLRVARTSASKFLETSQLGGSATRRRRPTGR